MLEHVFALSEEIGPRGTGTPAEAAAGEYVAARLADLGLAVERQTFRAVASQNAFPLAVDVVGLLAVVVYPLGGAATRWLAAALAAATPWMLWRAIVHSDSPLGFLLPHVRSGSVLAHIEPRDAEHRRAVILAHLDTNRCRLAWQSSAVRSLESLTWLTQGVLALLAALYLLGAVLGGPRWVWWASLAPAAYLVGTVVTLWRDERTPYTHGAHDNASSVAVALALAAHLSRNPLAHTAVWLAFTGAEETDHAGVKMLLRSHGEDLRGAVFLDLEGVGSGDLVYLTRQGLCFPYYPDPALAALAERVAARRADLGVRAAQMTVEDEVRTLRNHRLRALCIAGRDPASGSLPHWHRPDDRAETVSAAVMQRAADFVMAMLQELDQGSLVEEGMA